MKPINYIYILVLTIPFLGTAQETEHEFEIETQSGYEYNYFKSPDAIRRDGVVIKGDSIIDSSAYQDIEADYEFTIENKNHRLRLSANPSARIFYQNIDDAYWTFIADAKYDYEISSNTEILSEISFKRQNREGLDGAQDILINPLGYTEVSVNGGLGLELFKNNEIEILATYRFKDFDEFGVRDLQYNEYGIKLGIEQEFDVGSLEHELGVDGYFKNRLYDTFNASDVDMQNGERDWSYFFARPYYELPISKTFEIEPAFEVYHRKDNIDDGSTFTQFGPRLGITYDNDVTRIRSTFEFITRNYKNIEARNTNGLTGENTTYEYADFRLNAEHKLSNSWFLLATVYSRVRSTNYTDIEARSFRGYRNQYAGIGVLWEL